jgi:hypothetical protein
MRAYTIMVPFLLLTGCVMDSPSAATQVEISSQLDGVTARIGDATTLLSPQGTLDVSPPLTSTGVTLVLERDGSSIELTQDFAFDYEMAGADPAAPLEAITLEILAGEDGECTLGATNAHTGDATWTSDYPLEMAPCGPFR